MSVIQSMWRNTKVWRTIPLGPISVFYRLGRTVPVSNNKRRRLIRSFQDSVMLFRDNQERKFVASSIPVTQESVRQEAQARQETALIVGVGPGLGFAVARKLAAAGMHVALASRNIERLDPLVEELKKTKGKIVHAYGCDATSEISVKKMMSLVAQDMGAPDLVIYAIQGFGPGRTIDVEVPAFEECWRRNCLGAFIVAREAARRMVPLRRGTIILTGSPSSMIGRADYLNLAVGKFGLRALAQVMARELWPDGIHVVHLVIDADIKNPTKPEEPGEPKAYPEDIADIVHALHNQPKSAWTNELDVRPWNEAFWEHC